MTLHASVVGLFPEIVVETSNVGILKRAHDAELLNVQSVQIREFAEDVHRTVDATPVGGGSGMVMRIDIVKKAIDHARGLHADADTRVIHLAASGAPFTDATATRLAKYEHLILVCGRYEGIDARIAEYVDEEVCIGDFVLTGGELGAAVVIDATARKIPGVLGNTNSIDDESFVHARLEHRQYAKPMEFERVGVPPVLASGHHKNIQQARQKDALMRTQNTRADMLESAPLSKAEKKLLADERVVSLEPVRLS